MKCNYFEGKTILLAMPNHFGLPQRFKENLEHLGFKVFLLQSTTTSIPLKDKIIHGYKKIFLNDRTHKPTIKNKISARAHLQQIEAIPAVDYALFIRPDLFDIEVVKRAKQIAGKVVAYQWDGLRRYPLAQQYISLFDDFYVFDKTDLSISSQLKHTTNFYFDDISSEAPIIPNSVFFVGTYMKDRIPLLHKIITQIEKNGLIPNMFLVSDKKRDLPNGITLLNEGFSFKESIVKMQAAHYVLDLHNPIHNGLSFRTFESIGYQKKLITNNILVKEYDFYNPKNIYVIEGDSFEGFETFVKTPYEPIEATIREKYSFSGWIDKILK